MNCAYQTLMLYLIKNLYTKLCFGSVLKRSLSAHRMQVSKVIFVTVDLNCGLHAVSVCLEKKFVDGSVLLKPNLNQFLVFCTSLLRSC